MEGQVGQDVRLALRGLWRSRGFTIAAVLTLAIGMGATTLVFSIVDAVMLRPRPFGDRSDRLITLHSTHPTQAQDWDDSEISYPDLSDVRDQARTLEAVEGLIVRSASLAGPDESERVLAASITPGLFRLLGVEAALGRTFRDDEGAEPGFETAAILSDALWHRRFGGDPNVLGRTVPVNGRAIAVVGVMPPGFRFPYTNDLWLPYRTRRDEGRERRALLAIGLLREGVRPGEAQAELDTVAARLAERYPETNRRWGLHVMRIVDFYVTANTRRALNLMLGAVVFALLVAAINVAGLLVARGIGRQRELTLRAALGAGRPRLVRLLLVESLLLSIAGGLVGLIVAAWGLDALLATFSEPPPYWVRFGIDGRALAFVFLLALATTLVCGLLPALRASRIDLVRDLSDGGRAAGAGQPQQRLQGGLVVGQVALSLALLVSATLLVRSATRMQQADPGFDTRPLLSLRLYLAGDRYDPPAVRAQTLMEIVDRVRALPGAAEATVTGAIPADDGGPTIRVVPERGAAMPGEEIGVQRIPVTPSFWDTLGLTLFEGRTFTAAETLDEGSDAVIVNRRLAGRLWPGERAVGRRLGIVEPEGVRWVRVVGVAPDLVYEEFGEETAQSQLNVYAPYGAAGWRGMALIVRGSGDPGALAAPARGVLRQVDPAISPYDVLTLEGRRIATTWGERFIGQMFALFAVASLLMACLGAYGVMAYAAGRRTREIGVRLALGAKAADVQWLFLRRGLALVGIGLALGTPLAVATARAVESLLYGVSPWSIAVWTGLPLALAGAILLASYAPAWRASRTDPMTALRDE
jgi:predicted permease